MWVWQETLWMDVHTLSTIARLSVSKPVFVCLPALSGGVKRVHLWNRLNLMGVKGTRRHISVVHGDVVDGDAW